MVLRILSLAGGRRYHAVLGVGVQTSAGPVTIYPRALCGAKPGRRSAGWSDYEGQVPTCPRCIRAVVRRANATVRRAFTPHRGEEDR